MRCALVLLAIAAACVVADPVRPKNIIVSSTATFNISNVHEPSRQSFYTYYFDTKNQVMRLDYAFNNTVTISITNYISKTDYLMFSSGAQFLCKKSTPGPINPFTMDMFANAKYAGLKAMNGKIVNQWDNVIVGDPADPQTAYMDAFTGRVVQFGDHDVKIEINILSLGAPDAAYFKVPEEILDQCSTDLDAFNIPRPF
jgi:hypothetical protein